MGFGRFIKKSYALINCPKLENKRKIKNEKLEIRWIHSNFCEPWNNDSFVVIKEEISKI